MKPNIPDASGLLGLLEIYQLNILVNDVFKQFLFTALKI